MTMLSKHSVLIIFSFSLFFIVNPAMASMRESISNTITNMALDLSCDKNEQCKSIGFGDKACGGFQSYKIYSIKNLNEDSFIKIVNSYNALDKENNLKNNMASTCDILIKPSTSCIQGQCASSVGNFSIY